MFSAFLGLEPEKRERILKAALQEFAVKGYQNASTNSIVKEAGISKGLLFHYFKSKKDLFRFLCSYVIESLESEYNSIYEKLESSDIFERLKQITMFKIDLIRRRTELYNFALSIYLNHHDAFSDEMNTFSKSFTEKLYIKLHEGLNLSSFKEDIDVARALDIIRWTLDGYGNKLIAQFKDVHLDNSEYELYVKEIDEYYDLIKRGVYR